jgi:hypothetical protein
MDVLDHANLTKTTGVCGSVGVAALFGVDLSACVAASPKDAGILITTQVGGGLLPPDAHVNVSNIMSNAGKLDDLSGRSVCVAGAMDVGLGVVASACAGLKPNGVLSGIVSIQIGLAASTTPGPSGGVFYSDTWVLAEGGPPKNYRNPDGSCVHGSTGFCGNGSMDTAGVPTWP